MGFYLFLLSIKITLSLLQISCVLKEVIRTIQQNLTTSKPQATENMTLLTVRRLLKHELRSGSKEKQTITFGSVCPIFDDDNDFHPTSVFSSIHFLNCTSFQPGHLGKPGFLHVPGTDETTGHFPSKETPEDAV